MIRQFYISVQLLLLLSSSAYARAFAPQEVTETQNASLWAEVKEAPTALDRAKNGLTAQRSLIRVDLDHLHQLQRQKRAKPGFSLRVSIHEETFELVRVENSKISGQTWVFRSQKKDNLYFAHISVVDGQVSGVIDLPDTKLEIFPTTPDEPGLSWLIDHAAAGSTRAFYLTPDYLVPPPFEARPLWMQQEILQNRNRQNNQEINKVTPSPQSVIDLMVGYTPGMVTRYGSTAGVLSRLNTLVAYANTAYINSEVAITLSLVHAIQVAYSDSNNNGPALYDITGFNGSNSIPIPPSLSAIAGLRNTYGADLVALVRPFHQSTHGGCGVAWVGGANVTDIGDDAPFGYAVVSDGNDVNGSGFFCPTAAMAHELGHNMGLNHDRANGGSLIGSTLYAFGYVIPGSPQRGDIMSYAANTLPVFSNPNVNCAGPSCSIGGGGEPVGIAANLPIEPCINSASGCAPSQAASCTSNPSSCADAARALNFTRIKVANWRPSAAPSISGTITNASSAPVAGVTFCAQPAAGVSCTASNASGFYQCSVPSGWTGILHAPITAGQRIRPQRFNTPVTGPTTRNVTTASNASFPCNLDVDNNGLVEPQHDGLVLLRRMLGMPEASLAGMAGSCAANTSAAALFSASNPANFNATGHGSGPVASSDGLLLLRAMQGRSGTDATNGLLPRPDASYNDWTAVSGWLNTQCGYPSTQSPTP